MSSASIPMSILVYLSLTKRFCSVSIEQHRKSPMGERMENCTEIFNRVSQGIKSLALADLTDPDNKHHSLSTSVHNWSLPNCMVSFRKLLLTFVSAAFQQMIYTHVQVRGIEE